MAKNLRWKVLTIVAVVALSIFAFYPPQEKVKLGLDLKGGVQLVLRVQTDDALRLEVQTTSDRLTEQLKTANVPVSTTVTGATAFSVGQSAASEAPATKSCELAQLAGTSLASATTNLEAGAAVAPDAARQYLDYIGQIRPYVDRQLAAFCADGAAAAAAGGPSASAASAAGAGASAGDGAPR